MKKMTILVSLLAVLVLGISMTFANGSAVVIKDIGQCGILNEDGNVIITSDIHKVDTNSENDNQKLTCRDKLTDRPDITETVHWNYANTGLTCGTGFGESTTDWKAVVTPSGNVMLTCHFKN